MPRKRKRRNCPSCGAIQGHKQQCIEGRLQLQNEDGGFNNPDVELDVPINLEPSVFNEGVNDAEDPDNVDLPDVDIVHPDVDIVHPDVEHDVDAAPPACAYCCRTGCESVPLCLDILGEGFKKKRIFGCVRQLQNDSQVCSLCKQYLFATNANWNVAWTSTIYSLLTNIAFKNACGSLQIVPLNILNMWRHIPHIQDYALQYFNEKFTTDITIRRASFLSDIKSGIDSRFMDAHYREAFPNTVCPAGCSVFIDDSITLIPFHHYINKRSLSFTHYGANRDNLIGMRPDWPRLDHVCKIPLLGGMIVDKDMGLAIVTCNEHSSLKHEFVHVPRHPVLDTDGIWPGEELDLFAPVSSSVSLTQSGKSRSRSTSFPKVKLKCNTSGLSTFRLCRPLVNSSRDHTTVHKIKLNTVKNHPTAAQNMKPLISNEFMNCLSATHKKDLPSDESLKEYKSSGTIVSQVDAINMALVYNDSSNSAAMLKTMCPLTVNADYGRDAFRSINNSISKNRSKNIAVLSLLLAFLRNNLALRNLCHQTLKEGGVQDNASSRTLYKLVQYLSPQKIRTIKVDAAFRAFADEVVAVISANVDNVNIGSSVNVIVAYGLQLLITGVSVFEWAPGIDPLECFLYNESTAIVTLMDEELDIPIVDENDRFDLLIKGTSIPVEGDNHFESIALKWTPDTRWVIYDNANQRIADEHNDWMQINIFISKVFLTGQIKGQLFNQNGVQNTLLCAIHETTFLMPESRETVLYCPLEGCRSKVCWRCSYGFGSTIQCDVGICKRHARIYFQELDHQIHLQHRAKKVSEQPDHANVEEEGEEIELPPLPVQVDELDFQLQEPVPLFTDNHSHPFSVSSGCNHSSQSMYLLNRDLRCRDKVGSIRKTPISHQQTMHQIFSRSGCNSLPLTYPDAQLAPQIFYAIVGGAPVGGLPNILYSNYGNEPTKSGLASFHDHASVRLRDLSLPTSRDLPYLSHVFDASLNRCCQDGNFKQVPKKGLESVNRCFVSRTKDEPQLQFSGGNKEVERLSKTMQDVGSWDYFITITANESGNPSLKAIRDAAVKTFNPDVNPVEFAMLMQNLLSIICRAWHRYVSNYFEHLLLSKEKVLGGTVKTYWFRYEFQSSGSFGNLPHVHGGITLNEKLSYKERMEHTSLRQSRVMGILHSASVEDLLQQGIVKTRKEYLELYEMCEELHTHSCENSRQRCQKRVGPNKFACRVPRYPPSFEGRVINMASSGYSQEVQEVLKQLGLLTIGPDGEILLPEELNAHKFEYSNDNERVGSPTNGKMFAMLRGSTNVQVTDRRFQSAYVCKYSAGCDEKRQVEFSMSSNDEMEHTVKINACPLYNAKIGGAAYQEALARKAESKEECLAKEICVTEMQWHLLNLPYVSTNVEYVNASFLPPDRRGLTLKRNSAQYASLKNDRGQLKSVGARLNLPQWRKFSPTQNDHVYDVLVSSTMPDKVTRFNVRPPELMSVSDVESYIRWFSYETSGIDIACTNVVSENSLQDGLGRVIKVRMRYLNDVKNFFANLDLDVNIPNGVREMANLFTLLAEEEIAADPSPFVKKFVNLDSSTDVTVVYYRVPPSNPHDFLYYFLLRFGKISCERDLFANNSFICAYQNAGLIVDANHRTNADYTLLVRTYILKELIFLPITKRKFESFLLSAISIFQGFLTNGQLDFVGAPLITDAAIQHDASVKLAALDRERTDRMLDFLESLQIGLPAREFILAGHAKEWVPVLQNVVGQSPDSIAEQNRALSIILNCINSLQDPTVSFTKSPWLSGGPGSGKSHVMFNAMAYSLCQQIDCCIVSFTADRARSVGGCHIHMLFKLKVYEKNDNFCLNSAVDDALTGLMRSPHKLAYLKKIRIIFFEEIGLISAELLSVIDRLLQKIKEDDRPFGSVMIIATGDCRQLSPITGSHVWTSSLLLTCVDLLSFKHLVRSTGDEDLQKLITILRKPVISRHLASEVCDIFKRRCAPRIVRTWNEVDENYLRIVSTKAAMTECETEYLNKKMALPNVEYITSKAIDTVKLRSSDEFVEAQPQHSKDLNYRCSEKPELHIFLHSIMQLTFNNNKPSANLPLFSQGQRCLVVKIPPGNLSHDDPGYRVHVRLIPSGLHVQSFESIPEEWPLAKLKRKHSVPVTVGGSRYGTVARREQFPLKYYICLTVHKTLGETCDRVATLISLEKKYSFWEREMLLVLISRVRNLDHLLFVGNSASTLAAFTALMHKTDEGVVYINNRVEALDTLGIDRNYVLRPSQQTFKGLPCQIPEHSLGFVYILVSAKQPSCFFLHHAFNIRKDMANFNGSCGKPVTLQKRPWLLAGYACNFTTVDPRATINAMYTFYNEWYESLADSNLQNARNSLREVNWKEMTELGAQLAINTNRQRNSNIIFNVCLR